MELTRRGMVKGSMVGAGLAVAPRIAADASPSSPSDPQRLWYRRPAADWNEALPIGNGRIGAMVFGGVASERLQLNEDTIWAGGPHDAVNPKAKDALPRVRELVFAERYTEAEALANEALMGVPVRQMAYQTMGDLRIEWPSLPGIPTGYERELDLDRAVASTRFILDGVRHEREMLASPVDQVIAIRMRTDRRGEISCDLALTSPQRDVRVEQDGPTGLLMTARNTEMDGIDGVLSLATRLEARVSGGRVAFDNGTLQVRQADEVVLLLSMATNYITIGDLSADPDALTAAALAAVAGRGFDDIAEPAIAEHRRLFRRVSLDLGRTPAANRPTDERIATHAESDDPALPALYFDYGRYLLICSSRPGSQPANLQGIWNEFIDPPWGSKYTININTEMNYWPAEVANLPECVEPLMSMVEELAVSGAQVARDMYGARGWVAHHNTNLWRGAAPVDGAQWGLWPTGGAWLCTHLWEHWNYSRKEAVLRRIFPVLRGSAQFFLDTLVQDPRTGFMVTNPSISPENRHPKGAAICAGPAMDNQILRDLFAQAAATCDLLGKDPSFAAECRAMSARLPPHRIGAQGHLQEWQFDWDGDAPEPDHRHVSHLYALFPSDQIDVEDTPELAAAVRRSLDLRGDESTGWATAWRINLWARLRDAPRAHRILTFLLGPGRTYPNMLDAHPPFQIDGNFGGTRGICEMLVQCHGDEIRLLPALPSAWPTGSVRGLRLPGALGLDLAWQGGQLIEARLASAIEQDRVIVLHGRRAELSFHEGQSRTITPALFDPGT